MSGPLRLLFLGPPGAGKGTQASAFARRHGIPHLSTGDLLRAAVAAGTPLGAEADGYMRAGRLVPDRLVLQILRERLDRSDARSGFVLDGFPRTIAQARALEPIAPIDRAIWFDLPPAVLIARLSGRRVCPTCHRVYNTETRRPRDEGRCDDDGSALLQRPDDRPEAVGERLRVFERETAPLREHYRTRDLLRSVDAAGAPEAVGLRIAAVLAEP